MTTGKARPSSDRHMTAQKPRLTKVPYQVPEDGSVDEAAASLLTSVSLLLDGSNSWEQVWGKLLVAGVEPQAIGSALARLQRGGGVDEGKDGTFPQNPALTRQIVLLGWLAAQEGMVSDSEVPSLVGRKLQTFLSASEVAIFGASPELTAEIQRPLEQVGISKAQAHPSGSTAYGEDAASAQQQAIDDAVLRLCGAECALMICATRGSDRQLADMVNRASVANRVPAIYYHAQGLQVQIGPLVIPRQTACYECYRVRRDATLAPWERSLLGSADDGGQLACTLGAGWVTVDAIKLLARFGEAVTRGRVLFIDYYAGLPEIHTVLRLPRCTVCGDPRRPAVRLWDDSY